jgi:hypothetical protein
LSVRSSAELTISAIAGQVRHGSSSRLAIGHDHRSSSLVRVLPSYFILIPRAHLSFCIRLEESFKLGQLVPTDEYQFPSPPNITSLVDGTSQKPFQERLADFWKANPELNPPRNGVQTATQELQTLKNASDREKTATASILGKTSYIASTAYQKSCLVDPIGNASTSSSRAGTASTSATSLAPTSAIKDPSHCSTPIFAQRRVYLASDLGLRDGLEKALKARIEEAGGKCWSWGVDGGKGGEEAMGRRDAFERRREAEGELRKANVVVVRSREGWEYWHVSILVPSKTARASRRSVDADLLPFFSQQAYTHSATTIGNLSWLYHVLSSQTLFSPLDRLLHYPLPTMDGIAEFRGKVITISNYAGPARDYVRSMIECLGAKFEGAMSKSTDFVVTAR